ncbi:MAG: hydroxyethylthiazole kinase [Acidaminococcaceae bacterium]|nr:hydroxyethylthiazole kinase [Acidaminococcaceae bacterium]
MNLKTDFLKIVEEIRKSKPVIHHLTNYVSAESCADICLAAGASPIMADAIEEVKDIAKNADAVVINIGTISTEQMDAINTAVVVAKEQGIPVIFDPVGVMSSQYKLHFALDLLQKGLVDIIRCNLSECLALVSGKAVGRGLDNTAADASDNVGLKAAKEGAKMFNCIFAVTGAVDYVSDGKHAVVLNNGNPLLKDITGAGCMTSTLVACCASVADDMLTAAALGVVIMGQSAELAANFLEKKDGPGMFKARLMDAVYHVTTKFNVLNLEPNKV